MMLKQMGRAKIKNHHFAHANSKKHNFLKIFTLGRVFSKSSGFRVLKNCLCVAERLNRIEKAMFVQKNKQKKHKPKTLVCAYKA